MKTDRSLPPTFALRFFRWFCHPKLKDSIEGDLMELYDERVKEVGKRKADLKFIGDVLLLFRPGIIKPTEGYQQINNYGMFKNYFKVGVRNILKYKVFSFINIFGLAVAMSVCMLIILMLADQKSYDQFHDKKDRIYRVLTKMPSSFKPNASSPVPLANAIKADYAMAQAATHLIPGVGGDLTYQQKSIELRGFFADENFFKIFSYPLTQGSPQSALMSPNSIIITQDAASRLFPKENPIGKTVGFTNRGLNHLTGDGESLPSNWGDFTITGVIDPATYKSHIKFDVLVSASSIKQLAEQGKFTDNSENWMEYSHCYTYVLLNEGTPTTALQAALTDLAIRHYSKSENLKQLQLSAQPLTQISPGIFLGNPISFSLPIEVYYFLALLALIIIVLAGVNYTNLSTARALTRAKEIGVRKVTGARRSDLIYQFLSESVVIAFLSLLLAMVLLIFIKPAFKGLWVNRYLNFELDSNVQVYLAFALFALFVGVLAGAYPAFRLSRYRPVDAIRNQENLPGSRLGMLKFLSVSQFVVSLFFITTSLVLYNQFRHHLSIDYGFNASNLVNIKLQGNDYIKVSAELSKVPGVLSVSACDYLPATGTQNGSALKIQGSEKDYQNITVLLANENFANNLSIKLIAGKNLASSGQSDSRFILVNESAVHQLGFKHPTEMVGQLMDRYNSNETLQVIGVVSDFRFRMPSEQEEIKPLMIRNQPEGFRFVNVKIASSKQSETIQNLEAAWKSFDAKHDLVYTFYKEQLADTNKAFADVVSIIGFIAFLAIIIACLGLLGMAIYTAERKKKEVGIRKVLGAGERSIAFLLSREFLKMLALSIGIGAPLSYFVNNLWLQILPNRVEFGFGTVFLSTVILLLLGLLTIGSQTWRASKNNPIDSLRAE